MKKFIAIFLSVLTLLSLGACGKNASSDADKLSPTDIAEIEVEGKGTIKLELYGNLAPVTVANFKKLASEGFYDGLVFHRVIKNFVIQAGDPTGTGTSGSKTTIKGEFSSNGFENNLSHQRGVISMARRANNPDSASSQFFICQKDAVSLDGDYAAFGRVIEGMDIVDAIAEVSVDSNDKPKIDQVIKTITISEVK